MKKTAILFSFLFLHLAAFSNIDSLKQLLKTNLPDTSRLEILINISENCNENEIINYAYQAIKVADVLLKDKQIQKNPDLLADVLSKKATAINDIGFSYRIIGDNEKALKFYNHALKIREKVKSDFHDLPNVQKLSTKSIAQSLNNIAYIYQSQGQIEKSMDIYHTTILVLEDYTQVDPEDIENKLGLGYVYNNLATSFGNINDREQSLKYHEKALMIRKSINDHKGIAQSLLNIGRIHQQSGNEKLAINNFNEAIENQNVINDKRGLGYSYSNLSTCYHNIALNFVNPDSSQYYLDLAIKYGLLSLDLKKEVKDKKGIAQSLIVLGNIYYSSKKDYRLSIQYFKESLDISKELGNPEIISNASGFLAKSYAQLNDFKNAFDMHVLYKKMSDSISNSEIRNSTLKKDLQFEFAQKETLAKAEQDKKEALALEELQKQKIQRNGFIAGFVLMFALASVTYRNFRNKQKSNNLLQRKNIIIEEKQKEIIDSINYAKRIQAAILPPDRMVKKYLPESFVLYKPKDIVAGDFYWMHLSLDPSPLGEGKAVLNTVGIAEQSPLSLRRGAGGEVILFAAADCTGHGVPGAMVSVVCNNALNRSVREYGISDPGKILDKTREIVIQEFEKSDEEVKDGMDISLCAIEALPSSLSSQEKAGVRLHYAGANNPLWIIRPCHSDPDASGEESIDASLTLSITDYELLEIKADKQPIGKYAEPKPFTTRTIELQKGDTIYTFTDGYADQFGGPKGKKFKYAQLKELLLSIQNKTMDEQSQILNQKFEEWKGNLEQVDDVCVIGVSI
jgi:serine phosphatase RsbU (regulator of sigma subunit)